MIERKIHMGDPDYKVATMDYPNNVRKDYYMGRNCMFLTQDDNYKYYFKGLTAHQYDQIKLSQGLTLYTNAKELELFTQKDCIFGGDPTKVNASDIKLFIENGFFLTPNSPPGPGNRTKVKRYCYRNYDNGMRFIRLEDGNRWENETPFGTKFGFYTALDSWLSAVKRTGSLPYGVLVRKLITDD